MVSTAGTLPLPDTGSSSLVSGESRYPLKSRFVRVLGEKP